jgi:hypothetical protein
MFRKALLGGAALAVMTTGAAADELATLKAQLAALQTQVDTMQEQSAQAAASSSALRYERGLGGNNWGLDAVKDSANVNSGSGFTVAVTPTADLPAPVAEVTVYGYVAGHIAYDFDGTHGVANSFSSSTVGNDSGDHIGITGKQSRFGIKSKIDTSIGQIRTQIEGDFTSGGNSGSTLFRLRHAVGHWDMTPNWTFSMGQTWMTAALLPIGISTVDFAGALLTYSRASQIRLGYADGPLSWAVSVEEATFYSSTNMPNIAGFLQYDVAGGHQFIITGEVADWNGSGYTDNIGSCRDIDADIWQGGVIDADDADLDLPGGVSRLTCKGLGGTFRDSSEIEGNDELGWAVQAGANFNLADVATLTMGVGYGAGLLTQKFVFEDGFSSINEDGDPLEAWAFLVGLSFGLSETTSFNTMFSYVEALDDQPYAGSLFSGDPKNPKDKIYKVHANILWQPVKQMRMGWEVIWAQSQYQDVERFGETYSKSSEDGVRATFGTWFFF